MSETQLQKEERICKYILNAYGTDTGIIFGTSYNVVKAIVKITLENIEEI